MYTAKLTPRERDIIALLCCGQSNKEIASTLGIAHQTERNHLLNICQKLHLRDRTQVVIYALGSGLHDARQCWIDMGKM